MEINKIQIKKTDNEEKKEIFKELIEKNTRFGKPQNNKLKSKTKSKSNNNKTKPTRAKQ